ncbi:hypothetical protein QOT17_000802 [Balamuthia mandrillaris]
MKAAATAVDYAAKVNGLFPVDITLEEARRAIVGFPGFTESRKDDVIIFNYDFCFKTTFPDPNTAEDAETAYLRRVRRECRGLIFSVETGEVIARRLHKFFNVGELEETEADRIDLTRPHVILEKMDGSLVSPFLTGGRLRFGTKSGVTDLSVSLEENYLAKSKAPYHDFSQEWMQRGYTPLFEWCCVAQQIVVAYPEDLLMLISIRHNRTGAYVPYKEMVASAQKWGIPVVSALKGTLEGIEKLIDTVKKSEGLEGYVLIFQDNGEMYKIKSEWYFERSKKQPGGALGSQEKDVWLLALENKLDDIAITIGPAQRERVERFAEELFLAVDRTAKRIEAVVEEARLKGIQGKPAFVRFVSEKKKINKGRYGRGKKGVSKPEEGEEKKKEKEEASEAKKDDEEEGEVFPEVSLYFACWDGRDALQEVIRLLKRACSSRTKLDQARHLAENIYFQF